MSLADYHAKRKFDSTPEPTGGQGSGALRFVVQKHHATALHYDFRLEIDGVLTSWAIPKGPSLNPEDKHLAMITEDHPYDYQYFEGVIPKGNYGAGPVMIWDEGTYEPLGAAGQRDADTQLARQGVRKEHLTFILHGKKLNGEFALIKMKQAEGKAWLIVKAHKDRHVSQKDVTAQNRSVITGRTIEDIAAETPVTTLRLDELDNAPAGDIPGVPAPMLASLAAEPFDNPGWLYEIKWDGYRIMAACGPDGAKLLTRGKQDYTKRFGPVAEPLNTLQASALIDGEVTVVNQEGKPSFQDLQNYLRTGQGHLLYSAFDLLHLDGRDLTGLPLTTRKHLLQRLLGLIHSPHLQYSSHVLGQGKALFKSARDRHLEGLIAKRAGSTYQFGRRSRDWLKLKTHHRQEAVIIGWTEPRAGRQHFGALVLAVHDPAGQLVYAGHSGSGFSDADLKELRQRLQPLETTHSPVTPAPETNEPAHWVRPELVAEIEFTEWTADGSMRHPIFIGLRDDKPTTEVIREQEEEGSAKPTLPSKEVVAQVNTTGKTQTPRSTSSRGGVAKQPLKRGSAKRPTKRELAQQPPAGELTQPIAKRGLAQPTGTTAKIDGHDVHLTHLDKVYWPEDGITKGDLIDYYRSIAPVILPYLKDRPQSLHRYPHGITGDNFYQKDLETHPSWVKTTRIHSASENKDIHYVLCQNEATLVYLINLGCIELNPWSSRTRRLEQPDWCVIDLDPEDIPFEAVIETAGAIHDVLEELDVPSYPKTSGATGLHIYIPLGAKYRYDQVKMFAELIVRLAHDRLPAITSLERSPGKRQGKVYLDYLQNRHGQTLAGAYCVRPRPGATVSTPLSWDEVTAGLSPHQFTIKNIHSRLTRDRTLWQPTLGPGIDLTTILKRVSKS